MGSGGLVADSPVLPIIMADILVPTKNDLSDGNTFDYEIAFWVVLSLLLAGLIVIVTYTAATCVQRRSTAVQCSTGVGNERTPIVRTGVARTPLVRAGSVRTPRKHTVSHNEHKDIFNI
jgi:hypothetical protein